MPADPNTVTLRVLCGWLVASLFSLILPEQTLRANQAGNQPLPVLERTSGGMVFRWDLEKDRAELRVRQAANPFWQGPLLPSFWLKGATGERQFIKAKAVAIAVGDRSIAGERNLGQSKDDKHGEVALVLEGKGRGLIRWEAAEAGIIFKRLEVQWAAKPPDLVAIYFGMAPLSTEEQVMVPALERLSGRDGRPTVSVSRAPRALRSRVFSAVGILAMRTFPWGVLAPPWERLTRPLIQGRCSGAAMGSNEGWVAMGPGTLPDAALTLQIRSGTAALEWLYREDLWPGSAQCRRVWVEPLRLFWAPRAWDAYARLFDSFGPFSSVPAIHQQGHWNSWGNFKRGQTDLRDLADRVASDFRLPILVLDDGWETSPQQRDSQSKDFPAFRGRPAIHQVQGLGSWLLAGNRLGTRAGEARAGARRPALRGRRASAPRHLVHEFGRRRCKLLFGPRFAAGPRVSAGADAADRETI